MANRPGPGNWAPHLDDPDPPQPRMTPAEMERAAENVKRWMEQKAREEAQSKA